MNIEVVIADYQNPTHAKDLGYLLDQYANDIMGGAKPLPADIKQNLASHLDKVPGAFSVLAYVDNKPAGLVNAMQGFSTFKCKPLINIHDVAVIEEFRGLKLSHKMIKLVENVAIERQCCKLTLEVLEGNKVAQQSYQKFGFDGYQLISEMGNAMFWEKSLG